MALQPFTILKPSYPVAINWSDSLADGLVFYCLLDHQNPLDLVTGTPGTPSGGPTFRATQDGVAANLTSASSQYFSFASSPIWNVVGDKTILWRGSISSGSNYRSFLSKSGNSDDAQGTPFSFITDNSATPIPWLILSNSNYKIWSGPALSLNTWHTCAVRTKDVDTTPTFFLDGAFSAGSNAGGGGSGAATTNTNPIRVGRRADGAVQMDGVSSVVAVWGRQLTNAELIRLHTAPFSLLVPVGFRVRGSASQNKTVALTGVAGTGAVGTLLPSTTIGLTGTSATGSVGTLAPALSVPITGVTGTGAVGTLIGEQAISVALTGVAGTSAAGTMVPGTSIALSGASAIGYTGTLVPSGGSAATTGAGAPSGKAKRKRKARDGVEGNRDFTAKRNSRPGVAEEEIREVLAQVRAKMPVTVPLDAIEDDDEEAILWLI